MAPIKIKKLNQNNLNIRPLGLDEKIQEFYNGNKRIYINSQNQNKGDHIFDVMNVYFDSKTSDSIKQATKDGVEELLKATNLKGLLNINYEEFSSKDEQNFFNKLGMSKEQLGIILTNKLSTHGNQNKEYQLLVGDFNLNGLNGSYVGMGAIVKNLRRDYSHKLLVSHELGHMFKAAVNEDRLNTINNLGMHCFDNKTIYKNNSKMLEKTPCVMRQDFSDDHLKTLSKIGAIYCPDCINDMKQYALK